MVCTFEKCLFWFLWCNVFFVFFFCFRMQLILIINFVLYLFLFFQFFKRSDLYEPNLTAHQSVCVWPTIFRLLCSILPLSRVPSVVCFRFVSFVSFFSPLFDGCLLSLLRSTYFRHCTVFLPHSFLSLSLWSRMLFDNCFQCFFLFFFSFPPSLSLSLFLCLARSFHRYKFCSNGIH